ncbi:hypothetical protein ACFTUC_39040 [Streptomyces sp. NPDC056944]|uniref:hypothetical protein n=1 Tax=unclassified Streptomyces TaxID=2593676 RepID=UPI003629DD15
MTGIDWGTFPAWLSALLTGGSLLLGFYILLRDRRKEERQEALKLVITGAHRDADEEHSFIQIGVRNTADRPFYGPTILYGRDGEVGRLYFEDDLVEPGQEATIRVPRYLDGVRTFPLGVVFQDSNGYTWVRDVASFSLQRRREIRRGHPSMKLLRPGLFGTWRMYAARQRTLRKG